MTWYTYGTVAVYDAVTDTVKENALGGKFVLAKDGPAQPLRDLNGNTITQITSNPSGQSSQFQVEQLFGMVQFGDVVVTVWANEVAGLLLSVLNAVSIAQDAALTAQTAQQNVAAYIASNPGGGGGGGLPSGTTLDAIPNGTNRLAFTQAERDKLSLIADGATKTLIGAVDPATGKTTAPGTAKPGDWVPTPAQIGGVQNVAGIGRMWGRTAAQGIPSTAEGLQPGDYIAVDAT